jgi:hypothetical protein
MMGKNGKSGCEEINTCRGEGKEVWNGGIKGGERLHHNSREGMNATDNMRCAMLPVDANERSSLPVYVCAACGTSCSSCNTNGAAKCDGQSFCASNTVYDSTTMTCKRNCCVSSVVPLSVTLWHLLTCHCFATGLIPIY